jgi:hypothetical protein
MPTGWSLWRLSWFIARQFWWQFVASLAWVLLTLVLMRSDSYVRMQYFVRRSTLFHFGVLGGMDVRREFMQRFLVCLHVILGSYLRDAL